MWLGLTVLSEQDADANEDSQEHFFNLVMAFQHQSELCLRKCHETTWHAQRDALGEVSSVGDQAAQLCQYGQSSNSRFVTLRTCTDVFLAAGVTFLSPPQTGVEFWCRHAASEGRHGTRGFAW